MTTALSFSSIRDNRKHGKVADFLKDKISSGSHLSIASAYSSPIQVVEYSYTNHTFQG